MNLALSKFSFVDHSILEESVHKFLAEDAFEVMCFFEQFIVLYLLNFDARDL